MGDAYLLATRRPEWWRVEYVAEGDFGLPVEGSFAGWAHDADEIVGDFYRFTAARPDTEFRIQRIQRTHAWRDHQ